MGTHPWVIVIFKKWEIERKMCVRMPILAMTISFSVISKQPQTEHHQQSLSTAKDLGNKAAERYAYIS